METAEKKVENKVSKNFAYLQEANPDLYKKAVTLKKFAKPIRFNTPEGMMFVNVYVGKVTAASTKKRDKEICNGYGYLQRAHVENAAQQIADENGLTIDEVNEIVGLV